jgi:hypothetical protein
MTCDFPKDLVRSLWQKLAKQDVLYVVLLNGGLPFIEDPNLIPQEEYLGPGQAESLVLAFLAQEDAAKYAAMLPEIHDDLRPSALSVARISKKQLFSLIDEMTQVSLNDYDHPIRIDVAQQLGDEEVLSDVLYSPYLPRN